MWADVRCRACGEEYAVDLPGEETRCPACGSGEADFLDCLWRDFSCG